MHKSYASHLSKLFPILFSVIRVDWTWIVILLQIASRLKVLSHNGGIERGERTETEALVGLPFLSPSCS